MTPSGCTAEEGAQLLCFFIHILPPPWCDPSPAAMHVKGLKQNISFQTVALLSHNNVHKCLRTTTKRKKKEEAIGQSFRLKSSSSKTRHGAQQKAGDCPSDGASFQGTSFLL